MNFLVYSLVASLVSFYFLQRSDDQRADREGRQRASIGKKVMLMFFLFMVFCVLFYFLGNGVFDSMFGGSKGGDGGDMERPNVDAMIQRIPEEIYTGLPPFKSMSFVQE